jgi:predicted  nucleic acid-binding Zn-ribbon protein
MKQLKEKEEQVSTMNDHIKLLNDELKRIKTQNIKLYNYIQTLEKEGKKINNTLFNNTSSFSDGNNSIYGTNSINNLNNKIPFNIPTKFLISH